MSGPAGRGLDAEMRRGAEPLTTFREALVRPGPGDGNWVSRTNYPACGVVQTGPAEMSLFVQRHYGLKTAHLERLTLRLDGFASVRALTLPSATASLFVVRTVWRSGTGRCRPGVVLDGTG